MQSPFPPLKEKKTQKVDKILPYLKIFGKILRPTSLSILFAGAAAIVFAAITLVKAGEAKGLPVSVAAAANAPIFLQFGKVTAVAAVTLLIAEAIDSFFTIKFSQPKIWQYIATAACCICAFGFAFVIAPQMDYLLPYVTKNASIKQSFHALHEQSRIIFGCMILFAWVSLVLPIFFEKKD